MTLLRVLDWPFPALGKQVMVVLQKGKAGDFYNITWPGVSGVYTAMAPGRFAAALNQAPMRMHGLGYAGDWLKNRLMAGRETGLPPAHLLRQVFEQADSYETAKAHAGQNAGRHAGDLYPCRYASRGRAASSNGWKMRLKSLSWERGSK